VNVYGGATLELVESEVCNNKGRGVSVSDNNTEVYSNTRETNLNTLKMKP
jgi:hypothetical protein